MYRVLLCALTTSAFVISFAHAQSAPQQYPYSSTPSYGMAQSQAEVQARSRYTGRDYPGSADTPSYGRAQPQAQAPARQVQAPTRYAARGHLGGGFIEAIFGGASNAGQSANPYGSQHYIENPYSRFSVDPRYQRQLVDYNGHEAPGTVIVDTNHFYLYLVQGHGKAIRYGVGVGRPGFTWAGVHNVSAKREWPDWRPPDDMLHRRPDLPRYMPGGPDNPLGARALYLGSTLYRIHGSNEPSTIGTQVSSGCIRMRNEDVIDLYDRVKVGTKVVVL
jgi:lipoprotein-anchoring transpeptidase ErfK/SrfK